MGDRKNWTWATVLYSLRRPPPSPFTPPPRSMIQFSDSRALILPNNRHTFIKKKLFSLLLNVARKNSDKCALIFLNNRYIKKSSFCFAAGISTKRILMAKISLLVKQCPVEGGGETSNDQGRYCAYMSGAASLSDRCLRDRSPPQTLPALYLPQTIRNVSFFFFFFFFFCVDKKRTDLGSTKIALCVSVNTLRLVS